MSVGGRVDCTLKNVTFTNSFIYYDDWCQFVSLQASSDNPFAGMFNSNLPTNRSGSRVSGCAIEEGVTVCSRLVFLLSAVFVYCTTLETFSHAFHAKNVAKEPDFKADCAWKMENTILILRQENIEEVLTDRFPWNFEKIHFLFYQKHLIF